MDGMSESFFPTLVNAHGVTTFSPFLLIRFTRRLFDIVCCYSIVVVVVAAAAAATTTATTATATMSHCS